MAHLNRTLVYVFKAVNIFTGTTSLVKFKDEIVSKNGKIAVNWKTRLSYLLRGHVLYARHAQSLATGRMVGIAGTASNRHSNKKFSKEPRVSSLVA
tara:strand:+ start:229 stop:516 length:288 start_codon:yes stop_codon:yes gene_type:complete